MHPQEGLDPNFDVNGDGDLNSLDLDAWLVAAGDTNLGVGLAYQYGDANLDGMVDVSDFNIWNSNKFRSVAAWSVGDLNPDGAIDVSDFNLWNNHKFRSSLAVPEPAAGLTWLALIAVALSAIPQGKRNSKHSF